MTFKTSLMRGAAAGVLFALGAGAAAQAAAPAHHHKRIVRHHAVRYADGEGATSAEIRELRDEVHALQARLDGQAAGQAQTRAQAQQAQQSAAAAQAQVQTAQAQVQAQAQQAEDQIQTIPAQVATAVDAVKPKTDAFYYKGLKITPGGFLEAATIYRSRNLSNDMASSFNSIPFDNTRAGHTDESRFSARQSRLSLLVQGDVNPDTQLAMYGEFDFLGAAQTANSNESNSYTPRIRHLYATVDWNDEGWHLLAGQTWSLATMNSKGITPRNEVTPPQIDAQYVPGFVWTRQPQFRITKDFDKTLWLAVSVESPATTSGGIAPPGTGAFITTYNQVGSGNFNSANAYTLGDVPDVIVKAAYEADIAGRHLHAEVFGIGRDFKDRTGTTNSDIFTGGIGGGFILQAFPHILDLQASALTGKGMGRYGSAGLPDVAFSPTGRMEPIEETDFLAGATLHATPMLDIYAFAGEEHEDRQAYTIGTTAYGYGDPLSSNVGCYTEGGTCAGYTKLVEQATLGFWQKLYQGPFGRLQVGMQYSYTERHAFSGIGGAPIGNDSMLFTSLRYYPF